MSNQEDNTAAAVEIRLDEFISRCFRRFNLDPESDSINKENTKILLKELMLAKDRGNAWSDAEFDSLFNLFEEDEACDEPGSNKNGLDKCEFKKLIKRIAQL